MRAFKRSSWGRTRGFTLVELMMVVAIIGVLAALAIYGVRRYLSSSKTAEAKNTLGNISRAAAAAYQRENVSNELLGDGQASTVPMHALCLSAAAFVPATVPAGRKYGPSSKDSVDFNTGDQLTGWKCLKFAMSEPIYYQYKYTQGAGTCSSGATAAGFEACAHGDLDGNGTTSTFARGADIQDGSVILSTALFVSNELE